MILFEWRPQKTIFGGTWNNYVRRLPFLSGGRRSDALLIFANIGEHLEFEEGLRADDRTHR